MRASCPRCKRIWAHISKNEPAECPTCRKGLKPLSRLVGGRPRDKAEQKELEAKG